jgi:hypothetical protein
MSAAAELDLFGQDVIRRGAVFVGGNRIALTRSWAPGPRAYVIGCNPSDADAEKDDPTCRWWINWFRLFGFGGFTAGNLWPFCTSSPDKCREIVQRANDGLDWAARDAIQFTNLPAVVAGAKAADQVFVCWGSIARDDVWIEHVVEEIQSGIAPYPDLWCWGKTQSGAPTHPMARGKHRIATDQKPILYRPGKGGGWA